MELKDLLAGEGYDPTAQKIVLLRHRPYEANLARVMPWLISERADRCCQSNRNSTPIGAPIPYPARAQAMRVCHSARAAERAVL